ncbi:MAG TPA: transaldolase [Gammaproteobacteria bacterium]|nr:transaldolase [Gammaproteobacteria bacterium]
MKEPNAAAEGRTSGARASAERRTTAARTSPVKRLIDFGQSPWLDFIQRRLITSGELARLVSEWGLRGITSNPTIFEQAIAETDDYDADIERLAREGKTAAEIYDALTVADVASAADVLRPVYDATGGADGFVSLEVSPHLAADAGATIAEAKRLFGALARPNVMIKVPGTEEGLTALRALVGEGLNINVTLLFSIERYRDVQTAYLEGLEAAAESGRKLETIASVASFFLSRIDVLVDRELDAIAALGADRERKARALRGRAAIASARLAYEIYEEFVASPRYRRLASIGGRVQRLLWASTGTKDPAYSDVKYVEALIGPDTINTMPLKTLRAYDDHGDPAPRLTGHVDEARRTLAELKEIGIDPADVAERLLVEGLEKFVKAYDSLLATIEAARRKTVETGHAKE